MFKYAICSTAGWFRFFGYGLCWTKSPPLFSERNGYTKKVTVPGGWRIGVLKP